ncbi:MAG: SPL family radical SAM protein [bacterium]
MFHPKKIIISSEVRFSPFVKTILSNCPSIPIEYQEVRRDSPCLAEKGNLVIIRHKGDFYKPCPGTLNYLCCQYKILHIGLNCPLACSYCILQSYLDHPAMVVHANTDEMLEELDRVLSRSPSDIFRIGTGELTDSLVLDPLTGLSKILVPYFAYQPMAFLELKTKTDNIHNLEGLDHRGKTIVAWSLNSERIVKQEELGAPSIKRRLQAARKCQDWGYSLAFHFDPIFFYPGWEREYRHTIEDLFSAVKPSQIAWISLGCFRFMPKLKSIISEAYPQSRIIYEEFIRGMDGKMRYLEPVREEMYTRMISWIREITPHCLIYLCMESPKIWRNCFGFSPADNRELQALLDRRCLDMIAQGPG